MNNTRNFAGIEDQYANYDKAQILLQSIPYDGTSTWGKGADLGFDAFLEAAENMELYDIETNSEVYTKGIHTLPAITESKSPEAMYEKVKQETLKLLASNKYLTFIGGEHSVSIGVIEAYKQKFPKLSVLHLDAHADLRKSYLGSEYNHACAMHKASLHTNLVQVGIRSMDSSELAYVDDNKCYFAHQLQENNAWMEDSIEQLSDEVYLSIDLDVFDPSIFPSTGTPEPGGLDWYTVTNYLKKVFKSKNVVGFDIVEFSPIDQLKAPNFLVAKLYYKLLSYKFYTQINNE